MKIIRRKFFTQFLFLMGFVKYLTSIPNQTRIFYTWKLKIPLLIQNFIFPFNQICIIAPNNIVIYKTNLTILNLSVISVFAYILAFMLILCLFVITLHNM